jgi:hypothetical protein
MAIRGRYKSALCAVSILIRRLRRFFLRFEHMNGLIGLAVAVLVGVMVLFLLMLRALERCQVLKMLPLLCLVVLTGCYNVIMMNVGINKIAASASQPLSPTDKCMALAGGTHSFGQGDTQVQIDEAQSQETCYVLASIPPPPPITNVVGPKPK